MKRFILIVLSISLCISSYAGDIDIKTVRGTSLSELGDAFEVLKRFSSVSFAEGAFYIAGKGQAVIFVDGRRLERHLDLALIPASSIEKVEIVSEPRPEYGNNNGVILITLLEASAGEFHLTDVAEITVSPYAGGSNNAEVSGRKKNFYYEGGLAVSYSGTKDLENRTCDTYAEKQDKSGLWLDQRKVSDFKDINKDLSLAANGLLGFHITPEHQLSVRYGYDYLKSNGNWGDLYDRVFIRKGSEIDLVNPSSQFAATSKSNSVKQTHKVSLSYQGEADEWELSANIDLFAGIRTGRDTETESPSGKQECTYDEESRYSAEEGYSRFNASHALWRGNILLGFSFDNYVQDTRRKDYSIKENPIHNNTYNIIPGAYVSLEQDFGFMELDAGIHYQYFYSKYSPYEDDRTLKQIREFMGKDFISFRDQLLHPHLTLSSPVGKGKISAGIQTSTEFAQFSAYSVNVDYLRKGDASEAFALPGRKDELFLRGEWEWLQLKVWGTHNFRPIFTNIDGGGDFNGPAYWSMDWRLTLSPSIGIWTTDLTATIHKQWLHMELADPQDNLTAPLATVNWINSLSLPWGMRVDLSTLLRTKGAESNIYYRNILCKMDIFVQQPFLDNRLIVSLGVDNLLRTHQKAAYYTRMADMELDWNNRLEKRMFKLSVVISL